MIAAQSTTSHGSLPDLHCKRLLAMSGSSVCRLGWLFPRLRFSRVPIKIPAKLHTAADCFSVHHVTPNGRAKRRRGRRCCSHCRNASARRCCGVKRSWRSCCEARRLRTPPDSEPLPCARSGALFLQPRPTCLQVRIDTQTRRCLPTDSATLVMAVTIPDWKDALPKGRSDAIAFVCTGSTAEHQET